MKFDIVLDSIIIILSKKVKIHIFSTQLLLYSICITRDKLIVVFLQIQLSIHLNQRLKIDCLLLIHSVKANALESFAHQLHIQKLKMQRFFEGSHCMESMSISTQGSNHAFRIDYHFRVTMSFFYFESVRLFSIFNENSSTYKQSQVTSYNNRKYMLQLNFFRHWLFIESIKAHKCIVHVPID